jgi:hypothetical protein
VLYNCTVDSAYSIHGTVCVPWIAHALYVATIALLPYGVVILRMQDRYRKVLWWPKFLLLHQAVEGGGLPILTLFPGAQGMFPPSSSTSLHMQSAHE